MTKRQLLNNGSNNSKGSKGSAAALHFHAGGRPNSASSSFEKKRKKINGIHDGVNVNNGMGNQSGALRSCDERHPRKKDSAKTTDDGRSCESDKSILAQQHSQQHPTDNAALITPFEKFNQLSPPTDNSPSTSLKSSSTIHPIFHLLPFLRVIQTGLHQKRSPLDLRNWIACVLTLDGRDKFTKLLQYGSRLLSWYLGGLAAGIIGTNNTAASVADAATAATSKAIATAVTTDSNALNAPLRLIQTLFHQKQYQKHLLHILSKRFYSLYKALVESRKAFRLGRSFIEWDKLRSMGWGDYLGFMILHPLAGGVAGGAADGPDGSGSDASGGDKKDRQHHQQLEEKNEAGRDSEKVDASESEARHFERYDTHPIEEGEEEDAADDGHDHIEEHSENEAKATERTERYEQDGNHKEDDGNEEEEEEEEENDEDELSWKADDDEDDEESLEDSGEEKKFDDPSCFRTNGKKKESKGKGKSGSTTKAKVISRPQRPKLPTRISSNIGWGPSTTVSAVESRTTTATATATTPLQAPALAAARVASTTLATPMARQTTSAASKPPCPPSRTVSELGRSMYRPFPTRSSSMGSYNQIKEDGGVGGDGASSTAKPTTASQTAQLAIIPQRLPPPAPLAPPTPAWKLVGGTLKLIGLMGFWTFDNLAFLTGTGFLDPIHLLNNNNNHSSKDSNAIAVATTDTKDRMKRKARASAWACRFYFMGTIAGLYVNVREVWKHGNGALKEARRKLRSLEETALSSSLSMAVSDGKDVQNDQQSGRMALAHEIETARRALNNMEGKHFTLYLALLKSMCDFMVFSNNPGVDWHLKLRGKRNHEGLHCLGGLVSASTVLYNNFPNAE